jgi:hypothetical protein
VPPVVGATTIEPGEETTVDLIFEMGMHRGMGGEHLFRVGVPVSAEDGESGTISLYFQAAFQ